MRKSTKLPEGVGKKIIEALKSQPQSHPNADMHREDDSSFDEYMRPNQVENRRSFKQQQMNTPVVEELEWDNDDEFEPRVQQPQRPQQQRFVEENFDDDFSFEPSSNVENYEVEDDNDFEQYQEYQQEPYEQTQSVESYEIYETNNYNDDMEEFVNTNNYNDYEPKPVQEQEYEDDFYEDYQPAPQVVEKPKPANKPKVENTFVESPQQYKEERQYREEKPAKQKPQLSPNPDSNVNIITNLIHQLPAGVTKQTGAQIIRQTMEAMGIPMNKVLSEAQYIQDELGRVIKDNINTIEEYRNNIKNLEKDVQAARSKAEELEELVGLFTFLER